MNNITRKVRLFEISIDNLSMQETIETVEQMIAQNNPSLVVTPNVHHIYILKKDKESLI